MEDAEKRAAAQRDYLNMKTSILAYEGIAVIGETVTHDINGQEGVTLTRRTIQVAPVIGVENPSDVNTLSADILGNIPGLSRLETPARINKRTGHFVPSRLESGVHDTGERELIRTAIEVYPKAPVAQNDIRAER